MNRTVRKSHTLGSNRHILPSNCHAPPPLPSSATGIRTGGKKSRHSCVSRLVRYPNSGSTVSAKRNSWTFLPPRSTDGATVILFFSTEVVGCRHTAISFLKSFFFFAFPRFSWPQIRCQRAERTYTRPTPRRHYQRAH